MVGNCMAQGPGYGGGRPWFRERTPLPGWEPKSSVVGKRTARRPGWARKPTVVGKRTAHRAELARKPSVVGKYTAQGAGWVRKPSVVRKRTGPGGRDGAEAVRGRRTHTPSGPAPGSGAGRLRRGRVWRAEHRRALDGAADGQLSDVVAIDRGTSRCTSAAAASPTEPCRCRHQGHAVRAGSGSRITTTLGVFRLVETRTLPLTHPVRSGPRRNRRRRPGRAPGRRGRAVSRSAPARGRRTAERSARGRARRPSPGTAQRRRGLAGRARRS